MKQLIIIGASGFGREIAEMVQILPEYDKTISLKGFLVHKKEYLNSLDQYDYYPPILGTTDDYQIEKDDFFICALGDVNVKREVVMKLLHRNAVFFTLIHPAARVSKYAHIGRGTIVEANATIGTGANIGDFCLIQTNSIIAHDNCVGNFSRIDCNSVCVGNVEIGESVTIHTSAVINHGVKVGNHAVVGALSFVIRKVGEHTTVYGNPAKKLIE